MPLTVKAHLVGFVIFPMLGSQQCAAWQRFAVRKLDLIDNVSVARGRINSVQPCNYQIFLQPFILSLLRRIVPSYVFYDPFSPYAWIRLMSQPGLT